LLEGSSRSLWKSQNKFANLSPFAVFPSLSARNRICWIKSDSSDFFLLTPERSLDYVFPIGYEQQKLLSVRLNNSCNRRDDPINRFPVEFSNFRNN
jgi:hypothetical protein